MMAVSFPKLWLPVIKIVIFIRTVEAKTVDILFIISTIKIVIDGENINSSNLMIITKPGRNA
jgi:hypothetical protein